MHQPILSEEERRAVLSSLGLTSVDDLFSEVPPRFRRNADFRFDIGNEPFPDVSSEAELRRLFERLAGKNRLPRVHFMGAGTYDEALPIAALSAAESLRHARSRPASLRRLVSEVEGQVGALTGAQSVFLGFADTLDAFFSAVEHYASEGEPRSLTLLGAVPARESILAYCRRRRWSVDSVPFDEDSGSVSFESLERQVESVGEKQGPSIAIVGFPNRFGVVEDLAGLRERLPSDCRLIAWVIDAGALSLFDPSAADCVVGDLQPFAAPPRLSSAHLPFVALRGATGASRGLGRRSLPSASLAARVLTTLSLWGSEGFWRWGEALHSQWQYFARECEAVGLRLRFRRGQPFREGVLEVPHLEARIRRATSRSIWPGIPLESLSSAAHGDFSNELLVCIHSNHTKADLDELVEVLSHD